MIGLHALGTPGFKGEPRDVLVGEESASLDEQPTRIEFADTRVKIVVRCSEFTNESLTNEARIEHPGPFSSTVQQASLPISSNGTRNCWPQSVQAALMKRKKRCAS